MTDDSQRPSTDVLGALPSSRPHRRSAKRPAHVAETAPPETGAPPATAKTAAKAKATRPETVTPPATAEAKTKATGSETPAPPPARAERPATPASKRRLRQPPQPRGLPPTPAKRERPEPEESHDLVGGTIRAAAELTEISLTASARMLRAAVSWLPRR